MGAHAAYEQARSCLIPDNSNNALGGLSKRERRPDGNRKAAQESEDMKIAHLDAVHANCNSKLERLTGDLAAIADWKDELQRKILLAQLKFELVDCFDTEGQDALEAEVAAFKEVCARLCETMCDEDLNSEREAA